MYVIAHAIARATLPRSSRGSSRGAVRHRPEGGSERRARPGRAWVPHLAERGLDGLVWRVSRRLAWCFWAGRRDVWDWVLGVVWAGLGRVLWWSVTRPARGFGPPLAGCRAGVYRAGLRGSRGVFSGRGVGCAEPGFETVCAIFDVPKTVQR